jgi:hypothetical protein
MFIVRSFFFVVVFFIGTINVISEQTLNGSWSVYDLDFIDCVLLPENRPLLR